MSSTERGEAQAFVGMLQQLTGKGTKASDYLSYMYNSLHNPQKVWKLDDTTGKFNELTAFTKLMEGTTNEYIWRLGDHNGKLYVATMDAGIFYNYITQLTNGSFFKMSPSEKASKLKYIANVIKLLALAKGNEKADELREKLEQLMPILEQYIETEQVDEETIKYIIDINGLTQEISNLIADFLKQETAKQTEALRAFFMQAVQNIKDFNSAEMAAIKQLIDQLNSEEMKEKWSLFLQQIANAQPEELKGIIADMAQQIVAKVMMELQTMAAEIGERIDVKGIEMYKYINDAVVNNQWGFDLLRTSDGGESFEVITRTGFDDKYNYGCPSFLSTEEGLYFGTCKQQRLLHAERTGTEGYSHPSWRVYKRRSQGGYRLLTATV